MEKFGLGFAIKTRLRALCESCLAQNVSGLKGFCRKNLLA